MKHQVSCTILPPGLSSHFHRQRLGLSEAKDGAWVCSERQSQDLNSELSGTKGQAHSSVIKVGEKGGENLWGH